MDRRHHFPDRPSFECPLRHACQRLASFLHHSTPHRPWQDLGTSPGQSDPPCSCLDATP